MRKESQHCQFSDKPHPSIAQQCQDATKKYKRLNQIKSKNDFLDWLRSLPFQIRYLAVKVEAPGLAQITRQTLHRLEFKNDSDNKKFTQKLQKVNQFFLPQNILDSIVFTSDGRQFFDSICFDFGYIEFPQRLYELLMYSGQNVKKFNPIEDMQKNRKPISQSCEQIKYIKSKEELCKILVRILRHEVFFNTCYKQELQINDEKNRKKELSFHWKNLSQQHKRDLLYVNKKDLKQLFNFLADQKIIINADELEKQIAYLLKLEKNEFCNRIFKCKLKKSLTPLTDYHELIYNLWKVDYEKSKKRRTKKQSSSYLQKNEQSKYDQIYNERSQSKNKVNLKQNDFFRTEKQNSIDSFQTNETQVYQKFEETVGAKFLIKESFLNEFIQKKILKDIAAFIDYISNEANFYHKARIIAFQRIKFVLECYGIPIKVFGSYANGIAIKNSDIDIAIDNAILNYFPYCEESMKVGFSLQWLQGIFSGFQCMKNIKLIKTASIPIMKLTLDTSEQFQVDPNVLSFDIAPYLIQLNRQHAHSQVQIDITVETHSETLKCNHLGINTTRRINQWLQQFPALKSVILILKYFLSLYDLNATYKDGINTYGMVVMVVAVMRHLKIQKQQNFVSVLQSVLKFITEEFDEKNYGIDLRNKKDVFYKKQQTKVKGIKAELEILDPQNDGKNMTKKCYKYSLIKDLFFLILKGCFEDQKKQIISSYLKDKKLCFANTQNQQNLKKLSLQQIANGMQNPFFTLIKEHQKDSYKLQKQHEIKKYNIHRFQNKFQDQQNDIIGEVFEQVQGMILLRTSSIIKA